MLYESSGCQVGMIASSGCYGVHKVGARKSFDRAIHLLRTRFAFVGVYEEWLKSMCLFHVMFGGTMLDALHVPNAKPQPTLDSKIATWDLRHVEKVYEYAHKRFREDLKRYDVKSSTCALRRLHHRNAPKMSSASH
eukprot:858803-Amphidinium_carterae.1